MGRSNQADWMASWAEAQRAGGEGGSLFFFFSFFYLQSYSAFLLFILLVLICFILVSKNTKVAPKIVLQFMPLPQTV